MRYLYPLMPTMNASATTAATLSSYAENLIGLELPGGWVVTSKLPKPGSAEAQDLTGSFFSIGYIAEKEEKGKAAKMKAFLKVIDVEKALMIQDSKLGILARMRLVSDSHLFECNILDVCKQAKLDRIVTILAQGEIERPTPTGYEVPYILFELADGDVRKLVKRTNLLDAAWKLRVLHDVAVGVQQLHRHNIAHQDLKPSNVLMFENSGQGAKIGDMGRASRRGADAQHDGQIIAGAIAYAPPEQVFGITPERWEDRREGCDLYHLGTLLIFLFSGTTPTDYYLHVLDDDIRPGRWQGNGKCDYQAALPILTATFTGFVDVLRQDLPEWAAEELAQIVIEACHPDYRQRGNPEARKRSGKPIGIEMFVSKFDRLAKRAQVEVRR